VLVEPAPIPAYHGQHELMVLSKSIINAAVEINNPLFFIIDLSIL